MTYILREKKEGELVMLWDERLKGEDTEELLGPEKRPGEGGRVLLLLHIIIIRVCLPGASSCMKGKQDRRKNIFFGGRTSLYHRR